ncbi:hypothetical protein [Streptomyces sp. NBC_00887]|uniref:hypothetical protein n=1 Tax=Streptomyces sp. NBC_00887 TaxID=2975859 RepID=UPI00386987F3|nr:hypothetical protein OG844_17950 [Streptomyces sp. NBC_00887]
MATPRTLPPGTADCKRGTRRRCARLVCAASGVAPQEAGTASALACTSQQIGGAAGLALLVALATAGLPGDAPAIVDVADGLRTAMWVGGAASIIGGLLAFTPGKPGTPGPRPAVEAPSPAIDEVGARSSG